MKTEKNYHGQSGQLPGSVRCEACGGMAEELARGDAQMLRLKSLDEAIVTPRAFECAQCEVVIYTDEFTFGKFVPPLLKNYLSESTPRMLIPAPRHAAPQWELIALSVNKGHPRSRKE